jgi:hypothetical protein
MADEANVGKDEWVTVRTCIWGHEADVVRSVLEGSGIEVFIPDERMGTLRPHLLLGTGGVRVQVRAPDVARARELLDEFENGEDQP